MRLLTGCGLLCVWMMLSGGALAQPDVAGHTATGITTVGTESVPVKPQRLRLLMLLKAQGADPKSAIVALADHKLRVQKELETMKADKESIAFTASRLIGGDSASSSRMQQIQMQMQMQMAAAGGAGAKPTIPTVHTAVCGLKAEWPLPSGEGDALALLPATLNEQIKTRDLAGANNKPKLSAEAQEQLDELETMMAERYSYQDSAEPESKILFIATVSEETKQKATATAFAKATKEADALAQSTGQKRGKLLSLSSDSANVQLAQMFRSAYAYGQDTSGADILSKFESDGSTVTSLNPDSLALVISVSVNYALD